MNVDTCFLDDVYSAFWMSLQFHFSTQIDMKTNQTISSFADRQADFGSDFPDEGLIVSTSISCYEFIKTSMNCDNSDVCAERKESNNTYRGEGGWGTK